MSRIVWAKVVGLHWEDTREAVQEATLEVEHLDGSSQFFVIQVLRMTDKIAAGRVGRARERGGRRQP